ncbi:ubiquitin-conjugating enzyme E2 W [Nosema bombycis CQ1]|uniref:Ubiquitin-conjugating enzyme E2 W n=1 Tax=Nosema bombycis (strain CQ1 / CVCC 102059) TaxID=578461 RepID=R0KP93_NOSB1|nr:ubiquitin-conjugating enzyme E2 W [Nosema bombycis CQ1]|eukprot:EOB12516.1 ubiquitin-conjugating enzyme E2 W [Nosema bombycis CQ1]
MPLFSIKRFQKEIKILQENSNQHNLKILEINENVKIKVSITMSNETVYKNEIYHLEFKLDPMYPIESPEVIFVDLIPENERVYSNGHICLDILYDKWTPAHTLFSVCITIISMLSSSTVKSKPLDDLEYCLNAINKSPKNNKWKFD